jgi:hypothetical protein
MSIENKLMEVHMKKDNEASFTKKQTNEESLEISSTGYGYESVENVSIENPIETKTDSNPSCGGL